MMCALVVLSLACGWHAVSVDAVLPRSDGGHDVAAHVLQVRRFLVMMCPWLASPVFFVACHAVTVEKSEKR